MNVVNVKTVKEIEFFVWGEKKTIPVNTIIKLDISTMTAYGMQEHFHVNLDEFEMLDDHLTLIS